jgi:drug/metabolite transporter (DMT)-like permease
VQQKEGQTNYAVASLLILLAATAYALMGAAVKFGKEVNDEILVFSRNAFCLLLLLPWILITKPKELRSSNYGTQIFRSCAGLLNMYCFFYSIRYILLADAMVLNNTMPLFLPFVMWVWKRERMSLSLLPGLILGFAGIILILRPGLGIFQPAALLALASGFFMSISMAGIRELGKTEPLYRILFYYFAISTLISAIPLAWFWQTLLPSQWLLLFSVGLFAIIYQYFLTKGYQFAPVQVVSPLIYFAVVLSGLFDWLFWHKTPDILSYIGVLLVTLGAIWCILGQKRTLS